MPVRFLGTFLDDPVAVPHPVIQTLAKQLDIGELDGLLAYRDNRLRWAHTVEIRSYYGYREFVDPSAGLTTAARMPPSRLASLARFAGTAKVTAINRLPARRRLATLAAFVHGLEATAHDDALEVLERLLRNLFGQAMTADKKARLRTLKDLDQAATTLAGACQIVLDSAWPDEQLRTQVFAKIPRDILERALEDVCSLVRPPDDVYFQEWQGRYRHIRRFLPTRLNHLRFGASPAGEPVVAAFDW